MLFHHTVYRNQPSETLTRNRAIISTQLTLNCNFMSITRLFLLKQACKEKKGKEMKKTKEEKSFQQKVTLFIRKKEKALMKVQKGGRWVNEWSR